MNTITTQALFYLSQGISIIPIGDISILPDGKKKDIIYPVVWKKYQSELPTPEVIHEWFEVKKYPNIGAITGKISHLFVLDADSYKPNFDHVLLQSFHIPPTPCQKTGRGGTQYFFSYDGDARNAVGILSPNSGMDIRANGGMVILPPSRVKLSDGTYSNYSWLISPEDEIFAPLPEELKKLFHTEKKIKKHLPELIDLKEGEGRDSAMASLVGSLCYSLPETRWVKEIWQVMKSVNKTYIPPLPLSDLQRIYYSITKKESDRREEKTEIDLLFTTKGKTKIFTLNTENVCRILERDSQFSHNFRYDIFKNVFEIKSPDWRELENSDVIYTQTKISIAYPFFQKVGKDMVFDAIIKISKDNSIDSASDFLRSLVWDNIPRLDTWLTHTYGTPQDIYHIAVASNWVKGMVKRIIEPGCKFDYVLVLEGAQGSKKSTSLAVLGGSWHVETTISTDTKDFFMQFLGKSIIEFSEGETPTRTDVKRMKAIITMQSDKYRPPYERVSHEFPRRCVFAMTTNEEEYLKDETGNRRWFPVKLVLPEANIEWLRTNRDQLFAEAYHRVINLKETTYEFPKQESLDAQSERRVHDPNNDLIVNWYYTILTQQVRDDGITVQQVYREVLNEKSFSVKPLDKWNEMNIANVLRESLHLSKRRAMVENMRIVRWYDDEHLSNKYAAVPINIDWSSSDVQ